MGQWDRPCGKRSFRLVRLIRERPTVGSQQMPREDTLAQTAAALRRELAGGQGLNLSRGGGCNEPMAMRPRRRQVTSPSRRRTQGGRWSGRADHGLSPARLLVGPGRRPRGQRCRLLSFSSGNSRRATGRSSPCRRATSEVRTAVMFNLLAHDMIARGRKKDIGHAGADLPSHHHRPTVCTIRNR